MIGTTKNAPERRNGNLRPEPQSVAPTNVGKLNEGSVIEWANYRQTLEIAEELGRLVARGSVKERTAIKTIESFSKLPLPRHYGGCGAQLAAFESSLARWDAIRTEAPYRVRHRIRPLIQTRCSALEIMQAAIDANADLGGPLHPLELDELVNVTIEMALDAMKPRNIPHAA
jgi:hypothetical protein